jgi:hypothetical protein
LTEETTYVVATGMQEKKHNVKGTKNPLKMLPSSNPGEKSNKPKVHS